MTRIEKDLDTRYMTKEEFTDFVDTKLKHNMNSVINTINTHHNAMVDWQKKSLFIGFVISLIIIISLMTSIIVSYFYVNKMNEAMDELESVVISLIGEKAFDAISDNPDFDYMEFTKLIKIIIGAIQGVRPEDMDEDFFQEIETK